MRRVGDMVRLGQSSRDYVVGGPPERMPAEGPSKTERLEQRLQQVPSHATLDCFIFIQRFLFLQHELKVLYDL